jgi:DedD protein
MDEPALRDVERWKDKIEVRLDNRQVFFLFFGSALVACMLFVLGVIVGKRIESRGRADAPEIQDPLAVLDRVNEPAAVAVPPVEQTLAFPRALIGGNGVKAKPIGLQPRPAPAPVAPAPVVRALEAKPPATAKPAATARPSVVAAKPTAMTAPPTPADDPPAPAAAPPVKLAPPAPPPKPIAAVKPPPPAPVKAAPGTPVVVKTAAPARATAASDPAQVKGRFTLQLSSFPDRLEADLFAKKYAAQGAFIVTSEIPGKGTWYRVRMGNFSSAAEATAAKASFERQHNVIAYVAAR